MAYVSLQNSSANLKASHSQMGFSMATNFAARIYPLTVTASYMTVKQLHGIDTYLLRLSQCGQYAQVKSYSG
jgi:hypothetical protein